VLLTAVEPHLAPAEAAEITGQALLNRSVNEKSILQLIRDIGPLPKAEIARATHLSAQAASVNINRLLDLGLVKKGEPQKGRVGQPSTPIQLNADGAFSFGVKIGRQSTQVILVNFLGKVCASREISYDAPILSAVLEQVIELINDILRNVGTQIKERIIGIGIAQPFRLEEWADELGIEPKVLDEWAEIDFATTLARYIALPTVSINDATAACLAELVMLPKAKNISLLHIYIGTFVGGGLVLDGRLQQGHLGNAGALGSFLVCVPSAKHPQQLISVASRFHLERNLAQANIKLADPSTVQNETFVAWRDQAASGLAQAIISSAALVELDTVVIDSSLPMELTQSVFEETNRQLNRLKSTGVALPNLKLGELGAIGSGLGGAMLPICSEFTLMNEAVA